MPAQKNKALNPKGRGGKTGGKSLNRVDPITGKLEVVDKTELFMREFIKNGGNASQAALVVSPTTTLSSAGALGSYYLRQARKRGLMRTLIEKKGYDMGRLLDVAVEKMEKSKKPDWWDRIMKLADYEDFTSGAKAGGGQVSVNIFGAHKDITKDYIEGEVVEDSSEPAHED